MEQPKQQTKRKNSGFYALVALLLIITIVASGLGIYAWAKYTSSQNGSANAQVAKWYFDLKNTSGQSLATAGPIDLADTIDFSHVKSGTIAPGTNGQFQMVVDTRGTEVSLIYNIDITLTNCPVNLNFYSDANHTTLIPKTGNKLSFEEYLTAGQAQNYNQTINVYWDWPYETLDTNDDPTAGDTQDLADKGKTVTLSIVATGTETLEPPAAPSEPLPIGTSVSGFSTELNGFTLSNWKVFYVEGDYTYLIYGDYLYDDDMEVDELATLNISGLRINGSGNVWSDSGRVEFLNALTTKSSWNQLVENAKINGTSINQTVSENVWAIGTPDLKLWVDSWNESYPDSYIYIAQATQTMNDGLKGYFVGDTLNPETYYIDVNTEDTLYFPYRWSNDGYGMYGYWLATPSAYDYDGSCKEIMSIYSDEEEGGINSCQYDASARTIRPIIKLPTSVLN